MQTKRLHIHLFDYVWVYWAVFPYCSFTLAYPKFAVVVLHPTTETGTHHLHTRNQTPSFILLLYSLSLSHSLILLAFVCKSHLASENWIVAFHPITTLFATDTTVHHSVSTPIHKVVLLGRHGLMHIVRGARRESS